MLPRFVCYNTLVISQQGSTMSATAPDFLGLDKPASSLSLSDAIASGLPAAALHRVKARFGLTNKELARALGSSEKSIERNLRQTRIPANLGDRLYRLARLLELAVQVLGDEEQAIAWLREPQYGLAERQPLALMANDAGARAVEDELQRIRYGFLA